MERPTMFHSPNPQFIFYTPEHLDSRQTHSPFAPVQHMKQLPVVPTLPSTPIYSRPSSSCSQQPPRPLTSVPFMMTPVQSPQPMANRQSYFLENQAHGLLVDTEMPYESEGYGSPATPPLSTSGSIVSSPGSCEVLQTPLNPMFSGLEFEEIKEEVDLQEQLNGFAWSNNGSASPVAPIYLPSQQQLPTKPSLSSHTSDIASVPASHSPSPAPYTPVEKANFCDPRTLTVSASANPTLAPSYHTLPTLCGSEEEDPGFGLSLREPLKAATPAASFSFDTAVPDSLPAFAELSDLDSDCGDFTGLINFNGIDFKRPRTCSSAASLNDSFGSQDVDGVDPVTLLPTPDHSDEDSDCKRPNKKVKKEPEATMSTMTTATTDGESNASPPASPESPAQQDSPSGSQSGDDASTSGSPSSQSNVIAGPPPQHRRGRKQSLTEDPTKQFKCDICNRKFRRQEHLKRHHRSLHTHDKPFKCDECGKTFSRSDNLSQHQRTHGSGSIQLDVLDSGMTLPMAHGPFDYGRVLFSIGAELPGSDLSSEEDGSPKKNKRKREDGAEM